MSKTNNDVNAFSETDSDELLLDRVRSGDNAALIVLYNRHASTALGVAVKRIRDVAVARDVLSDTVANIWVALQNGKGPRDNFRSYFITAVKNECSSRMKRNNQLRNKILSLHESDDEEFEIQSIIQSVVENKVFDDGVVTQQTLPLVSDMLIGQAYGRLPEKRQYVLWEYCVEGKSIHELGNEFNISANAVSAYIYRAEKSLKKDYFVLYTVRYAKTECREFSQYFYKYSEDALDTTQLEIIESHINECSSCKEVVNGKLFITDLQKTLPLVILGPVYGLQYLKGLFISAGLDSSNAAPTLHESSPVSQSTFSKVTLIKIFVPLFVVATLVVSLRLSQNKQPHGLESITSTSTALVENIVPADSTFLDVQDVEVQNNVTVPTVMETFPVDTTELPDPVSTTVAASNVPITPSSAASALTSFTDFDVLMGATESMVSVAENTMSILSVDITNNGPDASDYSRGTEVYVTVTIPTDVEIIRASVKSGDCQSLVTAGVTTIQCVIRDYLEPNVMRRLNIWIQPNAQSVIASHTLQADVRVSSQATDSNLTDNMTVMDLNIIQ